MANFGIAKVTSPLQTTITHVLTIAQWLTGGNQVDSLFQFLALPRPSRLPAGAFPALHQLKFLRIIPC